MLSPVMLNVDVFVHVAFDTVTLNFPLVIALVSLSVTFTRIVTFPTVVLSTSTLVFVGILLTESMIVPFVGPTSLRPANDTFTS